MTKFCWICGKKFWGDKKYKIIGEDGHKHEVHKVCAKNEGYLIIPFKEEE